MRINIYIEKDYHGDMPNVCTEKSKSEITAQMVQDFQENSEWVDEVLSSRYSSSELYEKMLTEDGKEEVKYFLLCSARTDAESDFEEDYFATTLDI